VLALLFDVFFYFAIDIGSLVATLAIVPIQETLGYAIGFGNPTIAFAVAIAAFWHGLAPCVICPPPFSRRRSASRASTASWELPAHASELCDGSDDGGGIKNKEDGGGGDKEEDDDGEWRVAGGARGNKKSRRGRGRRGRREAGGSRRRRPGRAETAAVGRPPLLTTELAPTPRRPLLSDFSSLDFISSSAPGRRHSSTSESARRRAVVRKTPVAHSERSTPTPVAAPAHPPPPACQDPPGCPVPL
jgi:hypothetical protein